MCVKAAKRWRAHRSQIAATAPGASTSVPMSKFHHDELVNLTPHRINVCDSRGNVLVKLESAGSARIIPMFDAPDATDTTYHHDNGVTDVLPVAPVVDLNDADVARLELPPGIDVRDKSIVVSRMAADHISNNQSAYEGTCRHVLSPDTGPGSVVRDGQGNIIGVRQLTYHGTLQCEH